jgi:hypothetical protein
MSKQRRSPGAGWLTGAEQRKKNSEDYIQPAARVKSADRLYCDGRDADGEIISQIRDKNGEEIISIRRLPQNLLAVDITGDVPLSLTKYFLPQTQVGKRTLANGKTRWRFLYLDRRP